MTKAEATKAKWMENNGFSADGVTYVAVGNTYPIKDALKADGYKYCGALGWHGAHETDCECATVQLTIDEVVDVNSYGFCEWKFNAKEILTAKTPKIEEPAVDSNSEFMGTIGERLRGLHVTLARKTWFDSMYGTKFVYTFLCGENELVWFSTKDFDADEGYVFSLAGTVKEQKEYRGIKQTVLTRCTVKEIEN